MKKVNYIFKEYQISLMYVCIKSYSIIPIIIQRDLLWMCPQVEELDSTSMSQADP
jgi:hypothetical protein